MTADEFYAATANLFRCATPIKAEHMEYVEAFCEDFAANGALAKYDDDVQEYLYTFINDIRPTLKGKDYTLASEFAMELISEDWGQISEWFAICEDCGNEVVNQDNARALNDNRTEFICADCEDNCTDSTGRFLTPEDMF